jgi:NADH:ubiquinone oxidoreductase subunit 5 (subunit L)/multisubunit Na+/H+ antiporter MnhA subunit
MYRMGGLITLMPLSFIATLIGIIAVSGCAAAVRFWWPLDFLQRHSEL